MKRITSRKIRLGLTLKVYEKNGVVSKYQKRSKIGFFNLLGRVTGEKYDLRIYYRKGLTNEGTYYNKRDLKHAFRAFTEKGLLDDIEKEEK